jgi:antitoxin component of MazEF toxin-antitoxin module
VSADGSQICYPVQDNGGGYTQEVDPTIYDRAIRISSPRLADNGSDDVQPEIQRRVIRQVEVPYSRKVKVPVKTRKIVPTVVQKKVRTKKLVEVPSYKTVEEQYTEIEEVPAVRNKEIWVKKVVPEKYMKKVPVTKSRQVKVPTTVIKEVDDYEIVNVAGSKAIEVDGYRIDEVEDSKLVEVEEYQTYELRPFATGKAQVSSTREIGPVRGMHHSRTIGNQVFHVQDERVRGIDQDSAPDDTARSAGFGGRRPQSQGGIRGQQQMPQQMQQQRQQQRARTPMMAASGRRSNNTAPQQAPPGGSRLGASVRSTSGNGCVVVKVNPGEASERAGLKGGDIITYVNNRPTRNLQEFRQVINQSTGPLLCQVRRSGVAKLMITIQR